MPKSYELQRLLDADRDFAVIISDGTLHPYDLLTSRIDFFKQFASDEDLNECLPIINRIPEEAFNDRDHEYWNSENVNWDIDEIDERIEEILPDGMYIGCSEGDLACVGVWQSEELYEKLHGMNEEEEEEEEEEENTEYMNIQQ